MTNAFAYFHHDARMKNIRHRPLAHDQPLPMVYPLSLCILADCRRNDAPHDIPLTGDPQADADIMAFLKARNNVIQGIAIKLWLCVSY